VVRTMMSELDEADDATPLPDQTAREFSQQRVGPLMLLINQCTEIALSVEHTPPRPRRMRERFRRHIMRISDHGIIPLLTNTMRFVISFCVYRSKQVRFTFSCAAAMFRKNAPRRIFPILLVSRIQSSPRHAARAVANFGFERTLANYNS